MSYSSNSGRHPLFWPYLISVAGHLLLVAVVVLNPKWNQDDSPYLLPGAISVELVGQPTTGPAGGPAKPASPVPDKTPEPKAEPKPKPEPKAKPEPVLEKPQPQEVPEPVVEPPPPVTEPEISIAPKQVKPKPKTALKYQTIKSKEVLEKALKQLEQKVEQKSEQQAEQTNTQRLQDTLKRLKDQVAKQEDDAPVTPGTGSGGGGAPDSKDIGSGGALGQGKPGGFGQGGQEEPELIDLYRLEVAFQIQKNWAYAGTGGNLVAMIVFKVLPDGTIEDIFFTDRSGDATLDDSAYRAIVKSSPAKPHPPGIGRPYVEIGLRFTPQGVQ